MSNAVHFKEQTIRIRSDSKVEESFTMVRSDAGARTQAEISDENIDPETLIYSKGGNKKSRKEKQKNVKKKKKETKCSKG